jgi:hypothetical protein
MMAEILMWAALFFGSGFAGGFLGVVCGVIALRVVKNHQRRKGPAWAHEHHHHDWRGM